MSTSISLTISDEDAKEGKNFFSPTKTPNPADNFEYLRSDFAANANQSFDGRHTGLGIRESRKATVGARTSNLRRWRNNPQLVNDDDYQSKVEDFYTEVDDKMSRNSYEYPDQQARFVERWLNTTTGRSKSFDDDSLRLNGNVVGIRGFPSGSLLGEDKKHKVNYEKLKQAYLKLETECRQLHNRLDRAEYQHGRMSMKKELDLEALKAIVLRQAKQLEQGMATARQNAMPAACDRCKRMSACADGEFEQMRKAKNQLGLKLFHQEQEHNAISENLRKESQRLESVIQKRDREISELKNQVRNLSLEPDNRKLRALCDENARLREADELDKRECLALRENYQRLELRLKSLIEDQKCLNSEQNEDHKSLLLELCKLQVYQPKLEMILEKESQTRLHLQAQLESMRAEKEDLIDQLTAMNVKLSDARLAASHKNSNENGQLHNELKIWREKYQALERDYSNLDEAQRATKLKLARQETRLQQELETAREASQQEVERARANGRQLEMKMVALEGNLDRTLSQLDRCKSERDRAVQELLLLHQKLEESQLGRPEDDQSRIESISDRLKQSEQTISTLQQELSVALLDNKNLAAKLEMEHDKLEQSKQQYNELKRSFELQQKAFVELKEKRDKEVSKLRLDLNLEQYNRQVSLKGIEKELRSSLRELESMKFRFSKRLNVQTESSATATTTTTGTRHQATVGPQADPI